jgi:hypothetical protein
MTRGKEFEEPRSLLFAIDYQSVADRRSDVSSIRISSPTRPPPRGALG